MKIRNLALATVLVLLSACHPIGPHYARPPVATPPAYKEANDQWKAANPSDGVLKGHWWEIFNDTNLNTLEDKVTVSNQSVKEAEASFREARALVGVARADYFPTVSVGASTNINYSPSHNVVLSGGSTTSSGTGTGTTTGTGTGTTGTGSTGTTVARSSTSSFSNSYTLPFSVSWQPNFWGRVTMEVENAVANAQASAAELENVRLSMQAELATDYFEAHELDEEADVLNTSIQSYEKFLQLTINRFNGGVASKADVAQAQTQLDSTRAQATDLGVARNEYEHAIAVLIGQPPASFALAGAKLPPAPPAIPVGIPSQLLERRPDIANTERLMAAANAQVGLAEVAYYPTVSLSASAGLASSSFKDWFTWPSRFFSIGPSASETLLDFGRRRSTVAEYKAAYDNTVATYRQTVLSGFQEVEDNLSALRILATESSQQAAATRGAQESLQLELEMYKAGTVSYLNVIQEQNIALTNEQTLVAIQGRRMAAAVQLILALGGGWNSSTLPSAPDLKANVTNTDASQVAQPPAAGTPLGTSP